MLAQRLTRRRITDSAESTRSILERRPATCFFFNRSRVPAHGKFAVTPAVKLARVQIFGSSRNRRSSGRKFSISYRLPSNFVRAIVSKNCFPVDHLLLTGLYNAQISADD